MDMFSMLGLTIMVSILLIIIGFILFSRQSNSVVEIKPSTARCIDILNELGFRLTAHGITIIVKDIHMGFTPFEEAIRIARVTLAEYAKMEYTLETRREITNHIINYITNRHILADNNVLNNAFVASFQRLVDPATEASEWQDILAVPMARGAMLATHSKILKD